MNDEIKGTETEVKPEPTTIEIRHETSMLEPAGSLPELLERYQIQKEFIKKVLVEGKDYGVIPGTEKKTLLKPGAEKITTLFKLSIGFPLQQRRAIEDWTGEDHGGEPFFFYEDTCQLTRDGLLIAEASGSCNSWEKKYRYRQPSLKCPMCEKEGTIFRSKNEGEGWFCWRKKGGCGENFPANLADIIEQDTTPIKNPFIFDQVNTIKKMSQKRSLVAATLMAGNVSDYFTQDIGDPETEGSFIGDEMIENPIEVRVPFKKAKELFNGNEPTIVELFAADPEYCDWIYRNVQDSSVGDAMRAFVDGQYSVARKAKDNGYIEADPEIGAIVEEEKTNIQKGSISLTKPLHEDDWAPISDFVTLHLDLTGKDMAQIRKENGDDALLVYAYLEKHYI